MLIGLAQLLTTHYMIELQIEAAISLADLGQKAGQSGALPGLALQLQ
jgi:hypothetical protein